MPRRGAMLAVLVLLVLAGCGGDGETAPPAWNHDPEDASLGPAAWGDIDDSFEQCVTGAGQSPVDIAATVPAALPPLEFDYVPVPLVIENTGHVIEVPMPESSDQTLSVGDDEYRLVQYHFHAPSEHTLGGEAYAAEAHLVHEDEEGELAVVAVFLDEHAPQSSVRDSVLTSAPEGGADEVEVEAEVSPFLILPVEGSTVERRYYTYPGSLTTPGCSEGVRWIVLKETVGVSSTAVARLHELIAGFPGYDGYENNNRPTQPLNDRQIESSEPLGACGAAQERRRDAPAEERLQRLARHRLADEVALCERAAERAERVPDLLRLHAFRDDRQAEVPPEVDRGADDRRVARVVAHARDERAVDLDRLHRQPLEVRERGVAGAEVVDREPEPHLVQAREHLAHAERVGEDRRLGDLELELLGRHAGLLEESCDPVGELEIEQVGDRQVHGDVEVGGPRGSTSRTPAAPRRAPSA